LNLLHQIKDDIASATILLKKDLKSSIVVGPNKPSWRNHPDSFMVEGDEDPIFEPGSLDFAVGWFQARKDVWNVFKNLIIFWMLNITLPEIG
jgi:hypothetical protein